MVIPSRLLRAAIIAVGLVSLAFVLAPIYVEPLWNWVTFVGTGLVTEQMPSFAEAQRLSSTALAGFVICGIAYNWWRDRRFRRLQSEYAYQTGATHLKQKVADLETQLRKNVEERDTLEKVCQGLKAQLTAALVASKEHEVRSEYGRADREVLGRLREEFDVLMRAKGSMEGFREAMYFLTNQGEHAPTVERSGTERPREEHAAIPFMSAKES